MSFRLGALARPAAIGTAVALVLGASVSTAPLSRAAVPAAVILPAATWSSGITVATYNIHKASSDGAGESWASRRDEVAQTIVRHAPDVIALAEATPKTVSSADGGSARQYNDLLELIDNRIPYRFAAAGNYTNGTKLAYNADRLTLLAHGSKILRKLGSQRRYAVWATFGAPGGERFFVVATHLEPGRGSSTTTKYNTTRTRQAKQILALIAAENPKGHPVVVAGDFNSSRSTEPYNGPYLAFTRGGLVDPLDNLKAGWDAGADAIAEKLVDVEYNSANKYSRVAPRTKFRVGTNVDYVLVSPDVRVSLYQTVLDVDAEGRFVGTIPSDHNMVKAVIHLP